MNITAPSDYGSVELDEGLDLLQVTVEFFDLLGAQVAPDFVTGQGCPSVKCWDDSFVCSVCVNASSNINMPDFEPDRRTLPAGLDGAIFVRTSLFDNNALLSRHEDVRIRNLGRGLLVRHS